MKTILMLSFLLLCQVSLAEGIAPADKAHRVVAEEVDTQIESALKLMFHGNLKGAQESLQKVIASNPEESFRARWALGEVSSGTEWLPYYEVINQEGRWPEVYRYQQEREKYGDSFREQLYLADGCKAHGLIDEERAHLTRAMFHGNGLVELYERLGYRRWKGTWVAPGDVLQDLLNLQQDARNFSQWKSTAESIHQAYLREVPRSRVQTWQNRLSEIRTPDAIPALELCFASQSEQELRAYIDWLADIESCRAGFELAKLSVHARSPEARVHAQQRVNSRRYEEYVPYLLGQLAVSRRLTMAMPATIRIFGYQVPAIRFFNEVTKKDAGNEISLDQDIWVILPNNAWQMAPDGTLEFINYFSVMLRKTWSATPSYDPSRLNDLSLALSADSHRFLMSEKQMQSLIGDNVRTGRALRALSASTQLSDLTSDRDWWNWWLEFNDTELSDGLNKVVQKSYDEVWYADERGVQPVRSIGVRWKQVSCFAPGTLVETEHGQRKIDDVKVGDRVLSQDVETGELQFKPVFDITTREKASLVKVKTASEVITCSIGHPFWVVGKGWRMARELEPGMKLHTLNGTQYDVQGIQDAGTGVVYNLIVSDFGTYFAGSGRFYTHDVTPRKATDMVIPGLRKEFH